MKKLFSNCYIQVYVYYKFLIYCIDNDYIKDCVLFILYYVVSIYGWIYIVYRDFDNKNRM